jgi:hypothetical protein
MRNVLVFHHIHVCGRSKSAGRQHMRRAGIWHQTSSTRREWLKMLNFCAHVCQGCLPFLSTSSFVVLSRRKLLSSFVGIRVQRTQLSQALAFGNDARAVFNLQQMYLGPGLLSSSCRERALHLFNFVSRDQRYNVLARRGS